MNPSFRDENVINISTVVWIQIFVLLYCLGLQDLFIFQALPHVALLIVMLFFIYAVIGMQVSDSEQKPILQNVDVACLNPHISFLVVC